MAGEARRAPGGPAEAGRGRGASGPAGRSGAGRGAAGAGGCRAGRGLGAPPARGAGARGSLRPRGLGLPPRSPRAPGARARLGAGAGAHGSLCSWCR